MPEGAEIFNYYLTKEFAKRGHKIWVLTFCDHDWKNDNIHPVKLWRNFPGSTHFSIILRLFQLRNIVDIAYVCYLSNSYLVYSMLLAKFFFNVPYIISIHGGGMLAWKPKIPHQLFFKLASEIIAVSKTIKKEYEKRSSRKITIIPPLIPFKETEFSKNELRRKIGFDNDDILILYLGSIKKIKGSDILLNAFLNLDEDYIKKNSLKLLYVGDGPLRPVLERKIDEKSFSEYVKFFGSIPYDKVSEMYKLADIYVMPSLFEGTPIALLEAMFNGLPIIGTNVKGISNLITHETNGLLFERKNIYDLKGKIIELVEDKSLSRKLGGAAKKDFKEFYKFDDVISNYIKIMEKVSEFKK